MIINMINDATRVLGKSQGYLGLPIRDIKLPDGVPAMISSWSPTPEEMRKIAAGAPLILSVLGDVHPPVSISVGNVPDVG